MLQSHISSPSGLAIAQSSSLDSVCSFGQVAANPAESMPRPPSVSRPFSSCSLPIPGSIRQEEAGSLQATPQRTPGTIVRALVKEMYTALAAGAAKQATTILDRVSSVEVQLQELATSLANSHEQAGKSTSKLENLASSMSSLTGMLTSLPEATASAFSKMDPGMSSKRPKARNDQSLQPLGKAAEQPKALQEYRITEAMPTARDSRAVRDSKNACHPAGRRRFMPLAAHMLNTCVCVCIWLNAFETRWSNLTWALAPEYILLSSMHLLGNLVISPSLPGGNQVAWLHLLCLFSEQQQAEAILESPGDC